MILKQVIKYTNANAIEATWVDENDNIVKCQAYDDVQMDMLRADLGVDALQYETLITEVESKIIPYIKSEYEIAQEAKAEQNALKSLGQPYTLNGVDYQIPLDKDAQDTLTTLAVQNMAGLFVGTKIVFSNGVVMPLKTDELMPFIMWFSPLREAFFK